MRIFIGIKLENTVLEEIDRFLKPFKKIASPVRWTKPENLHITLKFIGEVTPSQYSRIDSLLSKADFNTGPIDLKFTGCGKFGRGQDLNILWVGLEQNEKLEEVYKNIETALSKAGIPREKRQFKPHITVARNKKTFNFKSFFKLIDEKNEELITEFTITHFQLYESTLTPEGPIYKILKEIPVVTA